MFFPFIFLENLCCCSITLQQKGKLSTNTIKLNFLKENRACKIYKEKCWNSHSHIYISFKSRKLEQQIVIEYKNSVKEKSSKKKRAQTNCNWVTRFSISLVHLLDCFLSALFRGSVAQLVTNNLQNSNNPSKFIVKLLNGAQRKVKFLAKWIFIYAIFQMLTVNRKEMAKNHSKICSKLKEICENLNKFMEN